MLKAFPFALLSLALGVASAATAQAADTTFPGQLCTPSSPTDAGKVSFSQFGVHNSATSGSASVDCGASSSTSAAVTRVTVTMYDRNQSGDVSCTILLLDSNGNTLASGLVGVNGSSPNPQTSFIDFNSVSSAAVDVRCSIPAAFNGAFSHITSYRVKTN